MAKSGCNTETVSFQDVSRKNRFLPAVARELNIRGLAEAEVFLAVGLPLTWVGEQKDSFKAYLLRNREVFFTFRGKEYLVTFSGAAVFPQGFSAVADRLREFRGVNIIWVQQSASFGCIRSGRNIHTSVIEKPL